MRLVRRQRRTRPDLSDLTASQLRELRTGLPLLPIDAFPDAATMLDAWELHRDAILDDWIAEHPGTRPFAMWLFELVPQHGERMTTEYWAPLAPYRHAWLTRGILDTHLVPPVQETEAEYLDRHGLLTDEERAAIAPIKSAVELYKESHLRWR